MRRWFAEYRHNALRALTGCARTTSDQTLRTVADILGIGKPHEIERRGVIRRTLAEHIDLQEIESHLDLWYPLEDQDR